MKPNTMKSITVEFESFDDFLRRDDKTINGYLKGKKKPETNQFTNCIGCWNCYNCTNCVDCINCNNCDYCEYSTNCDDCDDCTNCNNGQHLISKTL